MNGRQWSRLVLERDVAFKVLDARRERVADASAQCGRRWREAEQCRRVLMRD